METRQAYNAWASQYDTNTNKTRDLEAKALRSTLAGIPFGNCLEIGCGTGKNTVWLMQKAKQVTAIDLSEEMLAKAKAKISPGNVRLYRPTLLPTGISGTGGWAKKDTLLNSNLLKQFILKSCTF